MKWNLFPFDSSKRKVEKISSKSSLNHRSGLSQATKTTTRWYVQRNYNMCRVRQVCRTCHVWLTSFISRDRTVAVVLIASMVRVLNWWHKMYRPKSEHYNFGMSPKPQISSGFDSRTRRHMWVEFVVGSLLCSERFFSGYSGFPLSSKTNISKFQFDPEFRGPQVCQS